jgi:hypothetical protein
MAEAITSATASACRYGFPKALARWLGRNSDLIDALLSLRRLGSEAAEAVAAILDVRRVAEVQASWQLWEALTEGDGEEPEALVLSELPLEVVERARTALWGPSWRDGEPPDPDQPLISG